MDYEHVLSRLCTLPGPSGFEGPVAAEAATLLRPWMDEVSITRMGSVLGVRRCGKENAPKLLLDAHLDEIGFLITGHKEGFLTFTTLGGVDPRMLPDREVTILSEPPIQGVVACLPPHIQSAEDMSKSVPVTELYIDIGMTQEEALQVVPVGTPAVYAEGCTRLGTEYFCGKAMDDRACFAILLDVAERLSKEKLDVDLYILGSTQEETFSTGALTAAYSVIPDMCVAVDVTHGSSPDGPKNETFKLGGGPVIGIGPNCTRWMSERMKRKAEQLELDHQIEVMAGHSGTNAWGLQISREGVATAVLSLPLRYMHTPVEVANAGDLNKTAELLAAFVLGIGEEVPSYD